MSRGAKDKLITTHGAKISSVVTALFPKPGPLVDGFTGNGRGDAQSYVDDVMGDGTDDVDGALETFITAGHTAAWKAAGMSTGPDDTQDPPSRLAALLDKVPDMRDALIGVAVGYVIDALVSHDPPANTADLLDGTTVGDQFAGVELTATLSAGALDSAEYRNLSHVQLVTSAGECGFCGDFDGRIMALDDDSGMPPLHRGCSCQVEVLD